MLCQFNDQLSEKVEEKRRRRNRRKKIQRDEENKKEIKMYPCVYQDVSCVHACTNAYTYTIKERMEKNERVHYNTR